MEKDTKSHEIVMDPAREKRDRGESEQEITIIKIVRHQGTNEQERLTHEQHNSETTIE